MTRENSQHLVPHQPREPIDFVPVKRTKARSDGWTPQRQREFIAMIAATGNVSTACEALGMSQRSLYNLRRMAGAESFAAAWDAALLRGTDAIREKLIDHSLNGIPEPVFHGGKVVGERRRYNHRSMMWMVERGDRQRSGKILSEADAKEWEDRHAQYEETAAKWIGEVKDYVAKRYRHYCEYIVDRPELRAAYEVLHGPTDWEAIRADMTGKQPIADPRYRLAYIPPPPRILLDDMVEILGKDKMLTWGGAEA